MNFLLAIPLEARVLALFVLGVVVGNLLNTAIYAWAYAPRRESPWLGAHPRDASDGWADRLPIFGWLRLRRKSSELGGGFWLRPIVVELLTGLLFAWLYDWEVGERALFPDSLLVGERWGPPLAPNLSVWQAMHLAYFGQVVLFSLLLIGTFIDFDEQTIPDAVTMTATLAGLVFAAAFPSSLMPGAVRAAPGGAQVIEIVTPLYPAFSLADWPPALAGAPEWRSLAIALVCFGGWCAALLPWIWRPRRGLIKALKMLIAGAYRASNFGLMAIVCMLGTLGIVAVWFLSGTHRIDGLHWIGLQSALIGMAAGGGMIWAVRIFGSLALKREAMGFGDVTLMAAIGAFLGWQACVMIFFLAPCLGLAYGVVRLLLGLGRELPYGPFLCLAAFLVVAAWRMFWDQFGYVFEVIWLVPAAMAVCLVMVGVLLRLIRVVWPQ